MNQTLEIVEVGARDGLQNESTLVATSDKLQLIHKAAAAGIRRIEVASFVNPKRVPQMADAEAVCEGVRTLSGVTRIGLVLNQRGAARALETCVDELGTVASASDGFGIANQAQTSAESVAEACAIIAMARAAGRSAQVTISVAFGCPFDGEVNSAHVANMASELAKAQPREIAIADTIGVGVPSQVKDLIHRIQAAAPDVPIRAHFHNTRNTALANAVAAWEAGVTTLDGSLAGIGGCPFAPNATGNVPTEDLLYLFHRMGIKTGVDLPAAIEAARFIGEVLGKQTPGMVSRAGPFPSPIR
ncbi:MAG: hydroxymethylglutaryl-CoA lyase [Caulobacterales bacterium]|jgi:hydroxymethylglutaryl-CoA lyase